jgi:hypothetical protein
VYEILMAVWKCSDVVVTVVPRPWKEISLHFLQFSSVYFTILFTSILVLIMSQVRSTWEVFMALVESSKSRQVEGSPYYLFLRQGEISG